jgi:hypothetical protein
VFLSCGIVIAKIYFINLRRMRVGFPKPIFIGFFSRRPRKLLPGSAEYHRFFPGRDFDPDADGSRTIYNGLPFTSS